MGPYKIFFRKSAVKDFERLSAVTQGRVQTAVEKLKENPRPPGSLKLSGEDGCYRLRVGDHRIVYSVDDAIQIIAIERIRHRREVYRDL